MVRRSDARDPGMKTGAVPSAELPPPGAIAAVAERHGCVNALAASDEVGPMNSGRTRATAPV